MNNTSRARDAILQRLRAPERPSDDYSARHAQSRRDWDKAERVKRFTERLQAVRAEVHISDRVHWLELVADLCKSKGLTNLLLSAHTEWGQAIHAQAERFPALKSYDQPIEHWKQELFYGIDAGLTSTLGGVAETGSLILWPTVDEPRLLSLVPPIHFAILDTDKLYGTFAEAVDEQGWVQQGMPTNALLVSGPSKSADIAQVMAYGVHGPKELVVILV